MAAVEAASDPSTSSAYILVGHQPLLAGAQAIGNRLCANALWDKEHADWFGLIQVFERNWEIASAGLDLYNGLPGILLFLSYLGQITGEVRYTTAQAGLKTLRSIIQQYQASIDQVGIGAFSGNLEAVLLAAQTLHTPRLHVCLEHLTAHLLGSIQQRGWVMGVPLNVETPGLMLGLAGIGYQCLRLAEPHRVPSVLTLAPPPIALRRQAFSPKCSKP